jgi:hypothetical protein
MPGHGVEKHFTDDWNAIRLVFSGRLRCDPDEATQEPSQIFESAFAHEGRQVMPDLDAVLLSTSLQRQSSRQAACCE